MGAFRLTNPLRTITRAGVVALIAGLATLIMAGSAAAQESSGTPEPRIFNGTDAACPPGFTANGSEDKCFASVISASQIDAFEAAGADCSDAVAHPNGTAKGICSIEGVLPFMALLLNSESGYCTATLIDPEWVMTAAHCAQASPSSLRLLIGPDDPLGPTAIERIAKEVWVHPRYDEVSSNFDVALLHIDPVTTIKPIAVAIDPELADNSSIGTAAGWGRLGDLLPSPEALQRVDVPIRPMSDCYSGLALAITEPYQICAGSPDGGICFGDSGGPLFVRDAATGTAIQLGITSTSSIVRCGGQSQFTDVAVMAEWISAIAFTQIDGWVVECLGSDGYAAVDLTNTAQFPMVFTVNFNGFEKSIELAAGASGRLGISGRPDTDAFFVGFSARGYVMPVVPIDCDPAQPTVDSSVRCLAGNGLVTVTLTNPANVSQNYVVEIDGLSRSISIAPGISATVRVSGRPDKNIPISVRQSGVLVTEFAVAIDCDPDPIGDVSTKLSCLAGRGRIDVFLHNTDPSDSIFTVRIGALPPRTGSIDSADSKRVTATGRPNGPVDVVVNKSGRVIFRQQLTVSCH